MGKYAELATKVSVRLESLLSDIITKHICNGRPLPLNQADKRNMLTDIEVDFKSEVKQYLIDVERTEKKMFKDS